MRAAALVIAALLCFPSPGADAAGGDGKAQEEPVSIRLSSPQPFQGEPVLVEVSPRVPAAEVLLVWKGREFPMGKDEEGTFRGLIGVDLLDPPGAAPLSIRVASGERAFRVDAELTVRKQTFPVQELTLPREMAQFDAPTLERINREASLLAERFSRTPAPPMWRLPFLPPVDDYRPKGFGARRIINGEPRSPHAGVDITLPEGTPVMAIADGTVAFAGEQFFGGNSVVLDHGGDLFSVYYHLRDVSVSEGDAVSRGGKIGTVGASGRATGPHLHFSVRAAGGRIDPAMLQGLPSR